MLRGCVSIVLGTPSRCTFFDCAILYIFSTQFALFRLLWLLKISISRTEIVSLLCTFNFAGTPLNRTIGILSKQSLNNRNRQCVVLSNGERDCTPL